MRFGERTEFTDACALLDVAYENGITLFDTAEMYPTPRSAETQGMSELFVGRWLKDKPRERIAVSTKVAGPSGVMPWIRNGPEKLDGTGIKEALEGSLQRLQTDYIDIYYLHWPDRYVPAFGEIDYDPDRYLKHVSFEEQYDALKDCVEEGKVRCIGISNETPFGLMKFAQLSNDKATRPRFYSLQNAYHGLAECCHAEGIRLHAYSPLAMGLLTGKYVYSRPQQAQRHRSRQYPGLDGRYQCKPNTDAAVAEYADLAASAGITLTEMALRFVMHRPLVETAIMGATTLEQLKQNVELVNKPRLDEAVLSKIDAIHLRFPNPTP